MKRFFLLLLSVILLFSTVSLSYYTLGTSEVLPSLGSPYYKIPNYYSYGYPSTSYLRPYYGYGYGYLSYPSVYATYVPTIRYSTTYVPTYKAVTTAHYSTTVNYHYTYPTYAPYYINQYSNAYGVYSPYYTYPYGW
ncbi:MAG TPA: hypothetical protein PK466_11575 [Thermotogota bacterium]|nr:hypothetical protein [Thermotogota bacterium]HPJ89823.1 hypothetical protein [Thermotogota bacterium]HPR96964.1 hypothetical protein [Thermotogota bacterium]